MYQSCKIQFEFEFSHVPLSLSKWWQFYLEIKSICCKGKLLASMLKQLASGSLSWSTSQRSGLKVQNLIIVLGTHSWTDQLYFCFFHRSLLIDNFHSKTFCSPFFHHIQTKSKTKRQKMCYNLWKPDSNSQKYAQQTHYWMNYWTSFQHVFHEVTLIIHLTHIHLNSLDSESN